MENILARLERGDVIVGDGALGTMLIQRGLKLGDPPEGFNLDRPQVLEEIASLYLEAGAEIITTNTFGASPLRLQQFNLHNNIEQINRSAVEIVRRVVKDRAYVSGSVGPSSKMLKPAGDADPEEIFSSYRRQIGILLAAGVDMICIETMTSTVEAALAIRAARDLNASIPVMATMTFGKTAQGFYTLMGNSVADAAAELQKAGADIVGSNCGEGMENMALIAGEFCRSANKPVAIQGNAGLPVSEGTGFVYPETPEFVAEKAKELRRLGVQVIGGCCGTTPDHIRAIRRALE